MTQHDAKTAVRHLIRQVDTLKTLIFRHIQPPLSDEIYTQLNLVIDDIKDLERQLNERQAPKPNCRPATADELRQLCAASNVVMFPPAA